MRDGDLIRRGDSMILADTDWPRDQRVKAINALPAVQPVVKVKPLDDVTAEDAPAWYSLDAASAWASGYNSAILAALDVQPAPDVAGLVEALRDAERFMAYFTGETGGSFSGPGTPASCLASIRTALTAWEARND